MNAKSQKLIELKVKWDAVKDAYTNPNRMQILNDYSAEMTACGRRYFDDRLEAWAKDHGCLYGEETMLDMVEDGTLDADDLQASVEKHCGQLLRADAEMQISEQGHE